MTRLRLFHGLMAASLCAFAAAPARAEFQGLRPASEAEQYALMTALLADPRTPTADEPSCKADLSRPGPVAVAQALGEALARAAADRPPRVVRVDCFKRPGYPLAAGQEYCRLAFPPADRPSDDGFGLVFLMDWTARAVVANSVECY